MKSIAIRNNYKLEQHQKRLHFEDELPLVVAHLAYGHDSNLSDLPGPQMASMLRMLTRRFGQYAFNVIWVIEETEKLSAWQEYAQQTHPEGLTLVHELLKTGYGKYLAASKMSLLTGSFKNFAELYDTVLDPHEVELLIVPGPDKGSGHSPILTTTAPTTGTGGDVGGEQDE